MRALEDAVARVVWPEIVSAVAEAVVSVVCPVTPRVPPTFAFPEAERFVDDALASVVCPVTLSVEAVVVAKVEVPVTTKELVVVLLVVVRLVKNAVSAVKRLAKKVEEVALVVEAFVAKKFVVVAFTAVRLVVDAVVR